MKYHTVDKMCKLNPQVCSYNLQFKGNIGSEKQANGKIQIQKVGYSVRQMAQSVEQITGSTTPPHKDTRKKYTVSI